MTLERTHHHTRIRRRHGLTLVSCSCGWSQEAVSSFGAWLASRRHLDARAKPPSREWSLLGDESWAPGGQPLGGRTS